MPVGTYIVKAQEGLASGAHSLLLGIGEDLGLKEVLVCVKAYFKHYQGLVTLQACSHLSGCVRLETCLRWERRQWGRWTGWWIGWCRRRFR